MTATNRKPYSEEAQSIAYQSGVRQLAPLVDRIIALEKTVAELKAAIESLTPPSLRGREVR